MYGYMFLSWLVWIVSTLFRQQNTTVCCTFNKHYHDTIWDRLLRDSDQSNGNRLEAAGESGQ